MTNLCITVEGLPGIRRCIVLGQHKVTCHDHEGWREDLRPGTCVGCLPRLADHGYLCAHCYEHVMQAVAGWPRFRAALDAAEGRLVSPDGGTRVKKLGYSLLSATFLAVDECERLRASLDGQTVDKWVTTLEGARDAVMFAHRADAAQRSLEIEERQVRIEHVRCPGCGVLAARNPTRTVRGLTIVECAECGQIIDEVRLFNPRWFGTPTCEGHGHAECRSIQCQCRCHDLGSRGRVGGAAALWDADQFTADGAVREGWEVLDAWTVRPIEERKAA